MTPKQELIVAILFMILITAFLVETRKKRRTASYTEPIIIQNFLSESEIAHIKNAASDKLQTSKLVGKTSIDISVRDSQTAWLAKDDPVIMKVSQRGAALIGKMANHCESLQVLRYKLGGKYSPHQDANCNPADPNEERMMRVKENGRRIATLLVALTDDFEGGATEFPNLGKEYKLAKGDALLFRTLDSEGKCTASALHGGMPVTRGEKWMCNLWIHEKVQTIF